MTMTSAGAVVILWILFYSYWLISAIGVKKAVRGRPWWQGAGVRILLVIAAVLSFQALHIRRLIPVHSSSRVLDVLGVALSISGLGFAVWARHHLGRNWGTPMSLREGHELVTTGPYGFVRHPIYTGMLLAILGSSLVGGPLWFTTFLVLCPYLIYSARTEERLMLQQFPSEYPEYRKRTSALVPFVW